MELIQWADGVNGWLSFCHGLVVVSDLTWSLRRRDKFGHMRKRLFDISPKIAREHWTPVDRNANSVTGVCRLEIDRDSADVHASIITIFFLFLQF